MIWLCAEHITPRLKYIAHYVFDTFFSTSYRITGCNEQAVNFDGIKIYYGNQPKNGFFNIPATSGIIGEQHSRTVKPVHTVKNNKHYLFAHNHGGFDMDFDVFGAVFFMISRYEEYGYRYNFNHTLSLAFKHGFLDKPVVNIWLDELKNQINTRFNAQLKTPAYKHLSTIDIDNAYAYKNKSLMRHTLSTARSILRKDFTDITTRIKVLSGKQQDPYDTYGYIKEIHDKYGKRPVFFILLSNYGKYDKNISHKNKNYQSLIRKLAEYADVGIHPGYASNSSFETLAGEIKKLETILGRKITKSRQHFLMLKLPDTYRNLISLGIKEDYTMGFSTFPGYRAGTTVPFKFYDLGKEAETSLTIYPFSVMDVALNKYLGLTPGQAIETVIKHINQTKKYGGTFVSAWHNESLSEFRQWQGWRKVFEQILKNG